MVDENFQLLIIANSKLRLSNKREKGWRKKKDWSFKRMLRTREKELVQ